MKSMKKRGWSSEQRDRVLSAKSRPSQDFDTFPLAARTIDLAIFMIIKIAKINVAFAFYCFGLVASAQNLSNAELKELVQADKVDRTKDDMDWSTVDAKDKARASRVQELLQKGKIETAEDFYNAGIIFQHGNSPDDIKLAFSFATISARLAPEHPAPKWLAAAAWDRYMMWKKLPQWYGTQSQVLKKGGKTVLYPVLPDAVTDAERAEAQIPPLSKIISEIDANNK
jgi:hypothetical protein